MNAKMSSVLSMCFAMFVSGCSCEPRVEYVTNTQKVYIPVAKELPKVYCDLNQTLDTDVLYEAGKCIESFKQRDESFRGENNESN